MFHFRNYFHISVKLFSQHIIHKTINQQQSISLCYSATSVSKTVSSSENKFAHTVLEVNPKCRVLRSEQHENNDVGFEEMDLDQNWRDLTASGIVKSLETVGNYCKQSGTPISDERFDNFVDACTERCFDFSDDQLIQSLQILKRYPVTESAKSRNYVELWNAFDDACVDRMATWDYDKILYVCDHWYMLNLGRLNKFNHRGILKFDQEIRKLPSHQLVQLMFYLNLRRIPIRQMVEIELNLVRTIDELSLNEIAVVCMAFFKTQTRFFNPKVVEKICKRLIREIDTVECLALSCIVKALRYSFNIKQIALVRKVLDAVNGQLDRMTTLSCLHVALLGTNLHVCHQSCIEQILHRFSNDVESIRLKDFERISYVMGFFDFQSQSNIENRLCQQLLADLRNRVDEIVQYPKCFALCLHYLTMKGYHDEEMISAALSTLFLDFAYGNQENYGSEIFSLDAYVKINLKNSYTGNELTETNWRYVGKTLPDYIPHSNITNKTVNELKEIFDELCTYSYKVHVLPHFVRPDIIVAYDNNSDTEIDIAHNLPPRSTGKIIDRAMLVEGLNTDTTNVEIVTIIVIGWNNYVRDTTKLNGFMKQKIEQSKMLGLRPVLIPAIEWMRLEEGDRLHYVKYKLKTELRAKQ